MHPVRVLAALLSTLLCSTLAVAQNFPTKPIQVWTTAAGGGADVTLRAISPLLQKSLGQPIIIQNRGGLATIPVMEVAKAAPDGHTLLSLGGNFFWLLPYLMDDVPYDPVKDFAPVILTTTAPNVLVVNPSLPVNSVKELIALAKAQPGKLNFGVPGPGASPQLAAALFQYDTKINVVMVSYQGMAPVLNDLLGNRVQVGFPTPTSVAPHIKSGKLRALGVTSLKPTDLAPGMTPIAESGVPGFESSVDYVVFAPAKTPAAVIDKVNKAFAAALRTPEIKDQLFKLGQDVVASTPAQLAVRMKEDRESTGKVIKEAGIRAEGGG